MTSAEEFDAWWAEFPAKVGKLAAQKEYAKARKHATADELLEGLRRYRQHKPAWQQWAHARTWLHQGRWTDEYEPVKQSRSVPTLSAFEEAAAWDRERRDILERQKSLRGETA